MRKPIPNKCTLTSIFRFPARPGFTLPNGRQLSSGDAVGKGRSPFLAYLREGRAGREIGGLARAWVGLEEGSRGHLSNMRLLLPSARLSSSHSSIQSPHFHPLSSNRPTPMPPRESNPIPHLLAPGTLCMSL